MLRGGAASNLPAPDRISQLTVPALILSWADDTTHPVSTGEELARLLQHAEFHVAGSVTELRRWTAITEDFLSR